MRNTKEKEKLIEGIETAIDIEYFTSICFRRLTALVKNGKIRGKFTVFGQTAEKNKVSLNDYLNKEGVADFRLEERCTYCKIVPENFSLVGALDLGLEVTNSAIKHYKILSSISADESVGGFFKKFLKEKKEQKAFLIKEKKYRESEEDRFNIIKDFCIPLVKSMS